MKGFGQSIFCSLGIEFQKHYLPSKMNIQKTEYIDL